MGGEVGDGGVDGVMTAGAAVEAEEGKRRIVCLMKFGMRQKGLK